MSVSKDSKKSVRKGLALLTSISALGVMLTGCGAVAGNGPKATPSPTSSQPREGGNIQIDSSGNFRSMDPAKVYDEYSWLLGTELYDTLVTYKGTSSDIAPKIATSWDLSSDGTTYTFHLRKDAKFWNGDPVTAQSFIDEIQRVLTKSVSSSGQGFIDPIISGSDAYYNGRAKTISGLSAPDPYTLVIKLTKPEPFFLQVLAQPYFSAVDATWIKKVGDKAFDVQKPMGSGPFKLASNSSNQIVLVKNPHYWEKDSHGNRLPYLNKVTININTNANLDALNFEHGNTAFIGDLFAVTNGIPASAWPQFMSNPKLKSTLLTMPQEQVNYMPLNVTQAPFNKVKVRQAIEYAIDKQKIVKLMNGRATTGNQPLPPGIKGYVQNLPADATYTYDPAKAKELLKEAGYPNGFSTTLYTDNSQADKVVGEAVQQDLAAVGVHLSIHSASTATFVNQVFTGKLPMFLFFWSPDYPDASDYMQLFETDRQPDYNSSMYSNPQVDKWLAQAKINLNSSDRMNLYAQATNEVMKDAAWVPLYYPKITLAVQPWVHNFYVNPALADDLQFIWIDQNHSTN